MGALFSHHDTLLSGDSRRRLTLPDSRICVKSKLPKC